jgi:hypothetical protein
MNLDPRRYGGGERKKESRKQIRGESGDSSLHLDVPENAVIRPSFCSVRVGLPHCFIGNRKRTKTNNRYRF